MKKNTLNDLAVLGGIPAFEEKIHVGRPNIGSRERLMERIGNLLDTRWLSNSGPYVEEFEARIAEKAGVRHAVAMCNATVALQIAIRACGLTGEVIVPSFTFIATAHALEWQQITPVFCDIDPQTHQIDPNQVERLITPRTSGIIGVHLWGRTCDVDALAAVARRHHLKLLFDAAHAFGCSSKGRSIGQFGEAEVFSFHATKFLNTFEGGAVVTNDAALADKIRLMQNFGFRSYDDVVCSGTNGKMSEIAAAMGLTGLESLEEFIGVNYRNYQQYRRELEGVAGVRLLNYDAADESNYQYIVLEIDEAVTRISRDQLAAVLWAENVLARRYFYPGCHRMEPYRSLFPAAGQNLPHTEHLVRRVLILPTGTAVEPEQIRRICGIVRLAVCQGEALSRLLGHGEAVPVPRDALDSAAEMWPAEEPEPAPAPEARLALPARPALIG